MPAQSGHSDTLARMRRGYTRAAYSQLVRHIKAVVPHVGISSDFISGFCGETEEEHAATVDLLSEVRAVHSISIVVGSISPRSRQVSTKGVASALRNMVYRGVHNAKNTFMGVDSAVVCLSVVLINPHERDLAL